MSFSWTEPSKKKTKAVRTYGIGETQKHQPIVDRLHHPSAKPGQTGRDGTAVSEFFSMGGVETPAQEWHRANPGDLEIKKPVQMPIWTGFNTLKCLGFSADPKI